MTGTGTRKELAYNWDGGCAGPKTWRALIGKVRGERWVVLFKA